MPEQTTSRIRKIGVLTGGGDVPGLNAAIKGLVYPADRAGIEVVGLRAGWEGITYLDRARGREGLTFKAGDPASWDGGYVMPLNRLNTRDIEREGGTILQSTRTNPAKVKVSDLPAHLAAHGEGHAPSDRVDLTDEVLANINFLGLDGLVVIGGDDTLSYGAVLTKRGVPVWGIPKTMDNDVPGTEYAIGFQTAIARATDFINKMRSTAGSHSETVLFRMFGRDAGFTALETAAVTWADRVLIPEVEANIDQLAALIANDRQNPRHYSMVIMSEGANLGVPVPEVGEPDAYGHRKKENVAEFLAEELTRRLPKVRFLAVDLTYFLRSGEPVVTDKQVAINYANIIMKLIQAGTYGVMAGRWDGKYIYTGIPGKNLPARRVNPTEYNAERYRPAFERIDAPYHPQG